MSNKTRESFPFHRTFFDAMRHLQESSKSKLFDAICSYALDEKSEEIDGAIAAIFSLIKPQIDLDRKKFKNGCQTKYTEIEKERRFIKPAVEQIAAYCAERKNDIDAKNFYDFYQSKDWKVGKSKMKDWKACVRTWERKKTEFLVLTNDQRRRQSNLEASKKAFQELKNIK